MFKGFSGLMKKMLRVDRVDRADGSAEHFLGVGLYSVSESVSVIRARLQKRVDNRLFLRWSLGRKEFDREYASIIGKPMKVGGDYLFSFEQLIELLMVAAFRSRNVKPDEIRSTYANAREKYGDHPFAREGYRTDGVYIYTGEDSKEPEALARHQMFFEEVVKPILNDVSYVDKRAVRFSPLGTDKSVVLDPKIAFGSPVDRASGVPTAVLYGMKSSGQSDESIASWYDVSLSAVQDAIAYENALRKAA